MKKSFYNSNKIFVFLSVLILIISIGFFYPKEVRAMDWASQIAVNKAVNGDNSYVSLKKVNASVGDNNPDANTVLNIADRIYNTSIKTGKGDPAQLRDKVVDAGITMLQNQNGVGVTEFLANYVGVDGFTNITNNRIKANTQAESDFQKAVSDAALAGGDDKLSSTYNQLAKNTKDTANDVGAGKFNQGYGPIVCWRGITEGIDAPSCLAILSYKILQLVTWLFQLVAVLFNHIIGYTLDMQGFLKDVSIVAIGWKAFRDITNIFFIFIILYIAINTIIGNADFGIKKMLSKVIIAAVLINFSLFFTEAMIDVSNILTLQFYNKITINNAPAAQDNSGISGMIAHSIGFEKLWENSAGDVNNLASPGIDLTPTSIMTVCIGATIFMLITMFVLLAGAVMLVIRALTLVFLMILSPIAFVGGLIPSAKKDVNKWWETLTKNLLFAPVYMAFVYLVTVIASAPSTNDIRSVFSLQGNWIGVAVNMVVINMLMAGSIIIASTMGVSGSKMAMGYGKAGLGKLRALGVGATAGTAAFAYRNTGGRLAAGIASSPETQASLSRTMFGRSILKGTRLAAKGYTDKVEAKAKAKLDFMGTLSKERSLNGGTASAQSLYRDQLGSQLGSFSSAKNLAAANAMIEKNKADVTDENEKLSDIARRKAIAAEALSDGDKKNISSQIRNLQKRIDQANNSRAPGPQRQAAIISRTQALDNYIGSLAGNNRDFASLYREHYDKSRQIDKLKDKSTTALYKKVAGRGGFMS